MKHAPAVAVFLASVLFLSSCASSKGIMGTENVVTSAEKSLAHGDHETALRLYHEACMQRPDDKSLQDNYRTAFENIKKMADNAYRRGEYTTSGKDYFLLWQRYPETDASRTGLSFTKRQLDTRLDTCRSRTSQEALRKYRMGNLKHALALWNSQLAFDPENAGLKKATETTAIQIQNLESGK